MFKTKEQFICNLQFNEVEKYWNVKFSLHLSILFLRDDWIPVATDDVVILEVTNNTEGGIDVSFYIMIQSGSTQVLQYDVVERSIKVSSNLRLYTLTKKELYTLYNLATNIIMFVSSNVI